jgi:hypothetical protein
MNYYILMKKIKIKNLLYYYNSFYLLNKKNFLIRNYEIYFL